MPKKKDKPKGRAVRSRRGQGEDFTQTKENAVETRAPVHQADLMLPPAEVYQLHRDAVKKAMDARESAQGLYRKRLESAQVAGIDTDMMLEAMKIVRGNDPKAFAARLNQLSFCLEQEGFPIQIVVRDTLIGDEMAFVYRRFYQAGKAAETFANPYPDNSDLALQAARAWRHGNAANLGMTPEKADEGLDDDEREKLAALPPVPDMAQAAMH
jgi:hypothetical protein